MLSFSQQVYFMADLSLFYSRATHWVEPHRRSCSPIIISAGLWHLLSKNVLGTFSFPVWLMMDSHWHDQVTVAAVACANVDVKSMVCLYSSDLFQALTAFIKGYAENMPHTVVLRTYPNKRTLYSFPEKGINYIP